MNDPKTQMQAMRNDPVNHPAHYTSSAAKCPNCGEGIECLTITRHMNFNLGNVVKYLWRESLKGCSVQDLGKARFYLDDEIKRRGGK